MPNLFTYLGYTIFFWANENFEPIHVHICKGNPTANSTKVWITKSGDCILENNNSRIPKHDLRVYRIICVKFKNKPSYDKIKMS